MIISVGVPAYNEEHDIVAFLEDLCRQTLLKDPRHKVVVHIVANGCRDRTVDVSRDTLMRRLGDEKQGRWHVHSLEQSGKANAWNQFVHHLAAPESDLLFLLDADIHIPDADAMQKTVEALEHHPEAWVAIDHPLKDVALSQTPNSWMKLQRTFSETATDISTAITGQFYCMRAAEARKIMLPIGTIGEDGFLRAMIMTDGFQNQDEVLQRLIFVPEARHYFPTLRRVREILHHQVRLAAGTGLNIILFKHLRKELKGKRHAGAYVAEQNKANPNWLRDLLRGEAQQRYFMLEPAFILRRWRLLRSMPLKRRFYKAPVYMAGLLVDAAVFFAANRVLRSEAAVGYW